MLPKSYPGVPVGTPIITDPNHIPDGPFVFQLPSGYAVHHDNNTGERKYFDSNGQKTNQLEFLHAYAKNMSYGDPNAHIGGGTSRADSHVTAPGARVAGFESPLTFPPIVFPGVFPKKTPPSTVTMPPPTPLAPSGANLSDPMQLGRHFATGQAGQMNDSIPAIP